MSVIASQSTLPIPSVAPVQTALTDRFILTQVGQLTLVFPAIWVAEIMRIERSQILELPFYDPQMIGIVHHNGGIVPLISAHCLLQFEQSALREMSTVVRLNGVAGSLAHIGLVVDRAVGSSPRQELPKLLFEAGTDSAIPPSTSMVLINPAWLKPDLWQPQRWT